MKIYIFFIICACSTHSVSVPFHTLIPLYGNMSIHIIPHAPLAFHFLLTVSPDLSSPRLSRHRPDAGILSFCLFTGLPVLSFALACPQVSPWCPQVSPWFFPCLPVVSFHRSPLGLSAGLPAVRFRVGTAVVVRCWTLGTRVAYSSRRAA